MATQQQLSGNWNELKGRVEEEWGDVTNDEWQKMQGSLDQLIGYLQKRTGQAREQIEKKLADWGTEGSKVYESVSNSARDYANQAVESAKSQYATAQATVRRHPAEAVLVSFGTGLLLGVVLGLVSRSK